MQNAIAGGISAIGQGAQDYIAQKDLYNQNASKTMKEQALNDLKGAQLKKTDIPSIPAPDMSRDIDFSFLGKRTAPPKLSKLPEEEEDMSVLNPKSTKKNKK
jgi:hypothetical protein